MQQPKTSSSSTYIKDGTASGSSSLKLSQQQQPIGKRERVRIFVALFDYDPSTMSPNPESCEEELPFREGQLIKVRHEKSFQGRYYFFIMPQMPQGIL